MSHFFQPTSKVQKDRHIMRETDARMAKYSRRGLIFNFIAFLICMIGGHFYDANAELTVVLATGLLVFTVLRGFYLFRFDQLYPRGPMRWRTKYFIVTLLGAMWWGFILASMTIVLKLDAEAPMLWLYTVVFFSTTAHAFAPYHRFLSYYQFFGLIPAAAAAMYVGGWSANIYGMLMLMFYLILSHQCRLISDNYWEKLEAGYALGKRAINEDQERISSRASLRLSKEFIANLRNELGANLVRAEKVALESGVKTDPVLWNQLDVLNDNLDLFSRVLLRKLEIANRIFNIRHELQFLVSEFIVQAEQRGVQIETSLSPNLPMRLKGDPVRFAQVVRTLLTEMVNGSKDAAVILEVQFLREYESAGELFVTVRRIKNKSAARTFFGENEKEEEPQSLSLTIAKGLADLMDGDIEVVSSTAVDYQIRFNARLEIADYAGQLDFHKGRFAGRQILLVSANPAIVDIKRQELDALGFNVATETQFKRVRSIVQSQVKSGEAVENVLIYHEPNNEACEEFLDSIADVGEFNSVNKIIAASEPAKQALLEKGFDEQDNFYFLTKPLGLFELESTFEYIYSSKVEPEDQEKCRPGSIVIIGDSGVATRLAPDCSLMSSQKVVFANLDNLGEVLSRADNPMAIVPCSVGSDASGILSIIRDHERQEKSDESFIPILGVGQNCSESDIAAFEVGFDDYIDLGSQSSKTLPSMLRYWRSLDL